MLFRQLAGEQLGGTANAAEGVLDLVGQAAHQQFGGFLLGQLGFFLGDPQQAVARVHFQQQQGFAAVQQRGHGVVDGQGLAGQRGDHGFALGERVRLFHRLAQRGQGLGRFGEQLADELAMAALAADGQEHLRRRVHVLEAQVGVEQDHRGGQVIQQQSVDRVVYGHGFGARGDDKKMQEANQSPEKTRENRVSAGPSRFSEQIVRPWTNQNGESIEIGAGCCTEMVRSGAVGAARACSQLEVR
ncbi:hypothetical protein D3C85_699330 [compost metagenome]